MVLTGERRARDTGAGERGNGASESSRHLSTFPRATRRGSVKAFAAVRGACRPEVKGLGPCHRLPKSETSTARRWLRQVTAEWPSGTSM